MRAHNKLSLIRANERAYFQFSSGKIGPLSTQGFPIVNGVVNFGDKETCEFYAQLCQVDDDVERFSCGETWDGVAIDYEALLRSIDKAIQE